MEREWRRRRKRRVVISFLVRLFGLGILQSFLVILLLFHSLELFLPPSLRVLFLAFPLLPPFSLDGNKT